MAASKVLGESGAGMATAARKEGEDSGAAGEDDEMEDV
jgi:hypothetical protein